LFFLFFGPGPDKLGKPTGAAPPPRPPPQGIVLSSPQKSTPTKKNAPHVGPWPPSETPESPNSREVSPGTNPPPFLKPAEAPPPPPNPNSESSRVATGGGVGIAPRCAPISHRTGRPPPARLPRFFFFPPPPSFFPPPGLPKLPWKTVNRPVGAPPQKSIERPFPGFSGIELFDPKMPFYFFLF